jgi:hypothetical protein
MGRMFKIVLDLDPVVAMLILREEIYHAFSRITSIDSSFRLADQM